MALLFRKSNAGSATSLIGVFVLTSLELLESFGLRVSSEQVHAIDSWIAVTLLLLSAWVSWRKKGGDLPEPDPDAPPLFPSGPRGPDAPDGRRN